MPMREWLGRCALALAMTGLAGTAPAWAQNLALEPAFPGLRFAAPVALLQAPGADDRWYVVEQAGRVIAVDTGRGAARAAVFVDLRRRVEDGPAEAGLLGMAFHPDYQANGQVFISYTRGGSPLISIISRFSLAGDGLAGDGLDPASERIVLDLDQPFGNHNGGGIAFGPDGYLYIGLGDGGAGGDPRGNGQNTRTLLGAMLRIDVDGGTPYAIPPDNPFARGGGRPEIFAWGLRNPWRFAFDRLTGALWVGDVGQAAWEEVNRIERGGNYGWNIREGAHPYRRGRAVGPLIDPVAEYDHDQGCSITGGTVYRGERVPALRGLYVYGDYCSGRIWGLPADGRPRRLLDSGLNISAFGEGNDGELYVLDHAGGGVYRLAAR